MKLNFYLEFAGLIIGIILWFASYGQYKTIDLREKIYVHMVRVTTTLLGCNHLSYFIIRNNCSFFIGIAEFIVGASFFMMVWSCTYLNYYLVEVIHGRNYFPQRTYIVLGIPVFFVFIAILINWGNHNIYDVIVVEKSMQIIFNTWYKVPYVLAAFSGILYVFNLISNRKVLKDKRQQIFFVLPFLLVVVYYLQYHFKSIAIIGFGNSLVLLLLYIYSYNHIVKIDSLTRLPDGIAFKKMLDYRIGQRKNMVVAMISLDDFKQVNHEYGYQNGNRFLRLIALYLKEQAPKQCMARYGGDKFAIIFDELDCQEVQKWCNNILERFDDAWEFGKLCHKLSVCITLVEYPVLADSSEQILELLEYMNAYGKQNKRNQLIVCNEEFKKKMQRRLRITSILNDVVQEGKMYVEYQPILDVTENKFTRAEALFRLKDDELGDISPAEFFPIAEENGYIIDIGYTLLDKVCQYMKTIRDEGHKLPIISVNFFRQQFMADKLEQEVAAILEKYDIPIDNIAFELPESVFAVKYNEVKERILKMHDLGYRFYLDGFGNAFLDLSHLMELPFEIIKINKKMIREAENNNSIYLLVSALTAVFEENGKLILGDGIESENLKGMMDLLFMDFLQGHYLCEPVSAEEAKKQFCRTDVVEGMPNMDELLEGVLEESAITE